MHTLDCAHSMLCYVSEHFYRMIYGTSCWTNIATSKMLSLLRPFHDQSYISLVAISLCNITVQKVDCLSKLAISIKVYLFLSDT